MTGVERKSKTVVADLDLSAAPGDALLCGSIQEYRILTLRVSYGDIEKAILVQVANRQVIRYSGGASKRLIAK